MSQESRNKALNNTLDSIQKRWGPGTVMRLGDSQALDVQVIPSGSRAVDEILGIGGYPRGRVVEIFGPEASGKTTLALHAIAQVQATGGMAAFIDAEHALDPTYAGKLGVDTDNLLIAQPDCGEQALEITESLVRSGAIDLIVIDSVAALVPKAELEGDMGDAHMGLQARLMSQALRKITAITNRSGTTVMFINQLRQKIGVMFGNGEVTTGGNALKFYSSMRIDIRRIGSLHVTKGGEKELVGNKVKIRVVKNKLAPPFKTVIVDVMYGRGICRAGELIEAAEAAGVLQKAGSWYKLGEDKIGQGKENVRERLLADDGLFHRLAELVQPEVALAK